MHRLSPPKDWRLPHWISRFLLKLCLLLQKLELHCEKLLPVGSCWMHHQWLRTLQVLQVCTEEHHQLRQVLLMKMWLLQMLQNCPALLLMWMQPLPRKLTVMLMMMMKLCAKDVRSWCWVWRHCCHCFLSLSHCQDHLHWHLQCCKPSHCPLRIKQILLQFVYN